MNYVEHHFGDYAKDTAHLSMLEDGAYRRLLDVYYTRETPLPLPLADLCRLARAITAAERKAVQTVLQEFFEESPGGWRHKRCDFEIARYRDKQAKAKRSARARWDGHEAGDGGNANAYANGHANAYANASKTHGIRNAPNHQTPDTRHQTKEKDGAEAPVDVWSFGIDLLSRDGGLGTGTARSYIGGLCRMWPESTVLDALMAAAGKADPKAYARKWLESKPRKGVQTEDAATAAMRILEERDAAIRPG